MAKLKITDENGKERVHELIDDITTVGRASANVIQVTDEKASRNHFRVEKSGDRFKIVDLGSTNGTRLNGQKVAGEAFLRSGDQLSLGKTTFTYDGPGAPVESAPEAEKDHALTLPLDSSENKEKSAGPKYVLKVIEGNEPGKHYELGASALTLGRHSSNTIQIIDDAASNYHAEVNREPMGFVLTDLGSTNGTRVKARNKTEFEKIVKTPLSAGMQIRVGKTVLEFHNVGEPEEDEALFGTIALDPENLDAKLLEPRRGMSKVLAGALLVVVFAGVVGAVVMLGKPDGKPEVKIKPSAPDLSNKIVNGDFNEGTDDEGNPKHFKIERGAQGVKAEVVAEADYSENPPAAQPADPAAPKPPEPKRLGLRISKAGKSPSALTAVETANSISLDPGKAYELGGWMRNDGDGLFGLRVVWIAGEQKLAENPVVLKDTQEWKEKSVTLTPPAWAQRAKLGVFVQGKDGKACFDNLRFREKPDAEMTPGLSVKYGAITINFEGSKGVFSGSSQGERVLEDGTLLLVSPDESAVSDLASAIAPQATSEATKAAVAGQIYDFALQELTNYRIEAQQAGSGVELRLAIDSAHDTASRPRLRFYVVGPAAQGDVEVAKAGVTSERMQASENSRTFSGIDEVLFNAGKAPQFDLVFSKPADVEIKREGNRRNVIISFKGQLQIGLAPESVVAKQQMIAAIDELKKTLIAKKWSDAEKQVAGLRAEFATKFSQAGEEARKAQDQIDAAWRMTQEDVSRTIESLKLLKAPGAGAAARNTINRHVLTWAGSDHVAELQDKLKFIDEWEKENLNSKAEEDAENMYKQAEHYFNVKAYGVAVSILKVKIINDPVSSKTKVVTKAQELLVKAEAAEQRQQELTGIQRRLQDKTRNYILTNDFKGAIEAIEKDKEYQDNRQELPQIEELLKDLRKKLL